MRWHWLSFADGNLPKGSQFLGAALVRAPNFIAAVMEAHRLGINPGGEVQGTEAPECFSPRPGWCNRLLSRKECAEFDAAHDEAN